MKSADRYAVTGHPVGHSLSPQIHAAFAAATGEAVEYRLLPAALDAFVATVRGFAAEGGKGCNVTLPFKREAFSLAARPTPRAALAGACNTLRFDAEGDGGWAGDNTDGVGLCRDLEQHAGVALAGRRVLVVGAGGGAAGALGALASAGAAEVVVASRTAAPAEALVAAHRAALASAATGDESDRHDRAATTRLVAAPLERCGTAFDLVVNASASSVHGAPVPVGAEVLRPGCLAVDMMYGTAARPFLDWAEAHGATGRDGLGMLVEQAAEAFFFWRGVRPETGAVLAALRREVDCR